MHKYSAEYWDHRNDLAKHDGPRPHDRIPLRLQPVISPAMEVAIAVKALDNYTEAAALIEQYAQTVAAGRRADAAVST